jgi:hypothetical protein
MRLWTVHPQYLDAQGLVALWREGLIAGGTRGYTRHPQLTRFRQHAEPLPLIAAYLRGVAEEAARRGYQFDETKIVSPESAARLVETRGQLLFEWKHLQGKLRKRRPELYRKIRKVHCPEPHPLFRIVAGNVRDWEKTVAALRQNNQRTSTTIGRM